MKQSVILPVSVIDGSFDWTIVIVIFFLQQQNDRAGIMVESPLVQKSAAQSIF